MSNVLIESNTLDDLAEMIAAKSGEDLPLSLPEMIDAVHNIPESGGGITPTGNITITQAGVTDVTNYATATVPTADPWIGYSDTGFFTENNQRKWHTRPVVSFDERQVGWMDTDTTGNFLTYAAVPTGTSVTPTESAQTIGGANRMMEGAVTVNAISSTYVGSQVARNDSSDLTVSGSTVTAPAGYYASSASKTVASPVKTKTGTFTGNGTRTIDVACDFEPDLVYVSSDPGTTASSGTVAFIIARDMMAASRYRNNSTTNSHYAVTPCVNLNTSGSSYSWRATYANSKVTLYSYSNNTRALLTNGRTYTYKFVKWTT